MAVCFSLVFTSTTTSSALSFLEVSSKIRLVYTFVIVGSSGISGIWVIEKLGVSEWVGLLGYLWSIVVDLGALANWQWFKRRRRVGEAEIDVVDENNKEEKALAMPKIMRLIEE